MGPMEAAQKPWRSDMAKKVHLYALSTCGWCRKAKKFLEDNKIPF